MCQWQLHHQCPLPTVPAQPLIAMKPPTNANVLVTVVMMVPFVTAPKPVTTAPVQPERRQTVLAQRPLATKAPTDVNAIAPAVTMVPFVTAPKPVTTAFVDLVSLLTALAPHLIATTRPTGVSVTATYTDDGAFCNGEETCNNGICTPGSPPNCSGNTPFCNESLDRCECSNASHCDDSIACTTDQCIGGNCFNADNCVDPDVCNANTGICECTENCDECTAATQGTDCFGSCGPDAPSTAYDCCLGGYCGCCWDEECTEENGATDCAGSCGPDAPPLAYDCCLGTNCGCCCCTPIVVAQSAALMMVVVTAVASVPDKMRVLTGNVFVSRIVVVPFVGTTDGCGNSCGSCGPSPVLF